MSAGHPGLHLDRGNLHTQMIAEHLQELMIFLGGPHTLMTYQEGKLIF